MFTKTKEVEYINGYGEKRKKEVRVLTTGSKWGIGLTAAFLFFMIFMFRTVGAGQVGIVTRFGEVNRTIPSGIAIKLPWPIERLHKMDIRVQKEQQNVAAATSDLQDVQTTLALNYSIDQKTALKLYKEIGPDYKERVIVPPLQESFKAASAQYTATQLITERNAVKGKAFELVKDRLEKYGINVIDLNIVNFSFSAEFNQAIEAVQVANQNVAKARQELETTKVQAEKDITAARGQAEAQRLQQQTLTPELLQKMAIERWDGKLPTTSAGSNPFSILLQR